MFSILKFVRLVEAGYLYRGDDFRPPGEFLPVGSLQGKLSEKPHFFEALPRLKRSKVFHKWYSFEQLPDEHPSLHPKKRKTNQPRWKRPTGGWRRLLWNWTPASIENIVAVQKHSRKTPRSIFWDNAFSFSFGCPRPLKSPRVLKCEERDAWTS